MDPDTTRQQIQVSSRLNVIRKPWETTGVHVGYARCLVVPAFELVSTVTISDLADTAAAPISATTIRSTPSLQCRRWRATIPVSAAPSWRVSSSASDHGKNRLSSAPPPP
jgi:hypothetical protein